MSLLAPAFLAGLLAIGLPLWLHRLSSDNPNRRPFSSVMFLEAGEPQRVLARKLQYLLLLAFRIAVIAALVLAFIQPAFWRDPAAGAVGDRRLHIVVVDTSASMAAADHWDDALDTASDVIAATPVADPVQVIAAGRVLEVVTGATLDKAVARQSVQSLEPGVFHVDFGQLTRALDGVLRSAELPVVLHFVTDAQRSGLPTRFSELAPTEPVEIQVHAVTDTTEPNWAVENLFGSAQTGELAATVRSFADTAARKTLSLELNGTIVGRRDIELAPDAEATVEFDPLTLQTGANRVELRMSPGDELEADDVRMLALNKPVPHPVLIVSGELTGTADTLFLQTTMGILEGLAFDVTAINGGALADEDFEDYEFVVVADAAALDSRTAARLREYVATGGGLLLALGPRSGSLSTVPVTGHEFGASTSPLSGTPSASVSVGDIETSHPALKGVDSIRSARFWQYAALAELPGDKVLIRLQTGDPLLIESELGNGRVLVYASSLDREWNDLPKEPAFVPLVAGVADFLLGGAGFTNEAPLGSTLALQAMGMSGGQIYDPDGDSVLGLGGAGMDVLLEQIGFYELVGGGRDELVAVNFDNRESNLAPADANSLERWQDLGRAAVGATPTGNSLSERVRVPVGYWLLLLLLVAAVVESGLGNWHLKVHRGIAA
jgi:hypothetical protein